MRNNNVSTMYNGAAGCIKQNRVPAAAKFKEPFALKAPYSSKMNIFFFVIQERFNKLTCSINTIIKCGIWQTIKFQLVSRFWTV